MTSKISLFNKGIYKSTVKRYAWGSIVYFALLFLSTCMSIISASEELLDYYRQTGSSASSFLMVNCMAFPMLLSFAVPTVAGVMIFRFIHSKKASVFIHSLPIKRSAIYASFVMAGLTLMMLPVIVNGIILMILSAAKYSLVFSVFDCIVWILGNLFALFAMFSCVCLVASITGNSFAMVVLNILFHVVLLVLTAGFTVMTGMFLHGFIEDYWLIDKLSASAFPVNIFSVVTAAYNGSAEIFDIIRILVISLAFYMLAAILYKKRKLENAEDVSGFKCMNHVFKYAVTLIGALLTFSAFSSLMYSMPVLVWVLVAIVSMLVYFAAEMLLRKTVRVFKSYKGYIGFAAAFSLIVVLFAYTSFFGFETRVPDKGDVTSVAVHYYQYDDWNFLEDEDFISNVIDIHKTLIQKNELMKPKEATYEDERQIYIQYRLKDGDSIRRVYYMDKKLESKIKNQMYSVRAYKESVESAFDVTDSLRYMRFDGWSHEFTDKALLQGFMENVRKDMYNLTYDEIYADKKSTGVEIGYEKIEPDSKNKDKIVIYDAYIVINSNFKNTVKYMEDNGYSLF